jgi:type I restriction enzyme M protein
METKITISSFKKVFEKAAYGSSYNRVFEDFLTICICAFTQNILTGKSFYENEYMSIIEPYKANKTLQYFPELLAELVMYMEENKDNSQGNDLLGEFFQQEITHGRNGQFFTPFNICSFMGQIVSNEDTKSLNVLDPACGSGRMLTAMAQNAIIPHRYYGVDIDPLCVKMTAINLFLNGLRGEVICANALMPDDFKFGYRISFFPLGIFKIQDKEHSTIYTSSQTAFSKPTQEKTETEVETQLRLF